MSEPLYLRTSPFDRRYLIHLRVRNLFERVARPYLTGRLLDIGCGDKPMEDFLADRVTEHIGVDHAGSFHELSRVDVIASAYETKQPEASFDSVLCTNVLEHLEEPEKAIREAFRVLRPGGYAVYTVPLFWPLHEEPRDFYRFTRFGLNYLFEKAGFHMVAIQACGGYWTTAITLFNYYLRLFARGPFRPLVALITLMGNIMGRCLERLHTVERFTWMYLVVAQKPNILSPDKNAIKPKSPYR